MPRTRYLTVSILITLLAVGLSACAGAKMAAPAELADEGYYVGEAERLMEAPAAPVMEAESGEFMNDTTIAGQSADIPQEQERLIIRTADLSIIVDDTLESLDDIAQMASSMGGFVVSSNSYQSYESAYYGSVSIRVPAEHFDNALGQIKQMAVEVENETVTGQDVTEEFVDLEARVTNLKAAEEQLQEIMDNAQDTEDVLAVYNQLIQIRGEIESLEGRMKYLEQSAALSTINVSLEPNIVTQPVDVRWRPMETIKESLERLGRTMADVADFFINLFLVVLPTLLVFALGFAIVIAPFYFVVRGLVRGRRRRKAQEEG